MGGWKTSRRSKFLIDRCLNPRIATALRAFGFEAVTLGEVYGNDGQHVEDVQWIRDSAAHGYLVLTSNPKMVYVLHEMEAIRVYGAKVFCISKANHTRELKSLIVGRHLLRIVRRGARPGPCFWRIGARDSITYDIR